MALRRVPGRLHGPRRDRAGVIFRVQAMGALCHLRRREQGDERTFISMAWAVWISRYAIAVSLPVGDDGGRGDVL